MNPVENHPLFFHPNISWWNSLRFAIKEQYDSNMYEQKLRSRDETENFDNVLSGINSSEKCIAHTQIGKFVFLRLNCYGVSNDSWDRISTIGMFAGDVEYVIKS